MGDYLKRWGFTPQKPLQHAYKQDFEAVAQCLLNEYPAIERQAQEQDAVRQTPAMAFALRVRVNYIATISAQGTVRFKLYSGRFNTTLLLESLERLIAQANRKIFLIWDNHPVHWAEAVQLGLDEHQEQLEVFDLPTYSPELNPAEYLNCDIEQAVHSQPPTRSVAELKQRLARQLHRLQKLPQRVMNYFKHDAIAYAAAPL